MNNKMYDYLKWIAQYLLPALGTLYFALSSIWGLPYGEQVVGTITALDIFLGVLLGISTSQYNKTKDGSLLIDTSNPLRDTYRLDIDTDLSKLSNKSVLNLNIKSGVDLSADKSRE